ncbi:MAG: hypothetical protein Q8K93_09710 [Reyranella sp.]|uniref:hypothetical protein n=1 Tax=Reyranella sp. TaxID=1929291 RepID=UPI00273138F4|nr:hypothetical protein [Reyranella sp.]MDP1962464.1 hypothetical protein [Reyranella sp.]MDP2374295.1 hypothetical protein [Reyranella sp.]
MRDWYWLVAWAVAVGVFGYILPKAPGLWNKVVAVILVTLLGLGALVALYSVVLMLA